MVITPNIGQSAAKFELMNWTIREIVPLLGKLGPLSETDKERIESKTNIIGECWIWNGTKQYNGKGHQHGCIWYNRKYVQVHRLMYHNLVEDVPIYERRPGSMQVNHRCETDGTCINPVHLYLGTPKQNTKDCIDSGYKNKAENGENNHNAVLTNDTVDIIMGLKNSGRLQKDIARQYGVNQSQISRWWNKKTRTNDG
jgi:hypothetical protein